MASNIMLNAQVYRNEGQAQNFIFDCDFGTGTASIDIRSAAATAFKTVKTFSANEIVSIAIPQGAYYRANITGDAQLVVNYDD